VLKPIAMSAGSPGRDDKARAGSDEHVSQQEQNGDIYWPLACPRLHRTTLRVASLHNLPKRGERRPQYSGSRGACHAHVPELSGTAAPPDSSDPSSPALVFSLHPIGGFCAVSSRLPLPPRIETEITTEAITKGGLNAIFDQNIYCVAAEPHATLLRIGVTQDRVQEVAYATIVLGKLRPGYRVFQLRGSQHGTRIELCHLFVHIGVGGRLNLWQNPRQMRIQRAQGGRRFKQKLEEKEAKHVEELASLREELARLRPSEATSP